MRASSLDSSKVTEDTFKQTKANVLMSGTLTPQSMYADLLGIEDPMIESYESPFPDSNRKDFYVDTVTSMYKKRDDEMFQKIAWYIKKTVENIPHNSAVFFPSYSLLKEIRQRVEPQIDRDFIIEDQEMDADEKNRLADKLKDDQNRVLFAVVSGSMGEGIDYPGEMLKAVILVGLPLPTPNLETKQLVEYLEEKTGNGSEYVYDNPAVNKALQASGRCIRSREDEGFILYLDERYGWSKYNNTFPENIRPMKTRAPWREAEKFFGD